MSGAGESPDQKRTGGLMDSELETLARDLRTELAEVEATLAELAALRDELIAQLRGLDALSAPQNTNDTGARWSGTRARLRRCTD